MHVQSAVRDLQHERSGRVADNFVAWGEAKCFIRHKTTPQVLLDFQRLKFLIKLC